MTPHQQTQVGMVGGTGVGATNVALTWVAAYGPAISLALGAISVGVVVLSFALDYRRKDRQEAREVAEYHRRMGSIEEDKTDVGIP